MRIFSDDTLAVANIWAEARGEPFAGKCAVGEVMRNRMRRKFFSNGTLADTIFRKLQFSGFNHDNPWRFEIFLLDGHDPIVRDCLAAWIKSESTNYAKGAVLYCNERLCCPSWALAADRVAIVGMHSFFLPERVR
jgi:N-acetylmuramoyl-L-alanine amidase